MNKRLVLGLSVLALAGCSQADGGGSSMPADAAPPLAQRDEAPDGDRLLLWGDTHLHTINSADAYETGVENADIDTAYRFARGEPVNHPRTGQRVQIDRPYDFLVVADHAEMLSVATRLRDRDPMLLATEAGRRLLAMFEKDANGAMYSTQKLDPDEPDTDVMKDLNAPAIRQSAWNAQVDAAERYNQPGVFTAMIGWEWSATPNGLNLHRVVFTPADGATAKKFLPLSNFDTMRPEGLWQFLRETSERTGAEFVAIPHNSNFSNGLMFALTDSDGQPITSAYASERMAWEPVVEVTQYKGTSETYPSLAPRDEFAEFELRRELLGPTAMTFPPGSFVRQSLTNGLGVEARTGVNPFAFGMIGSTDSHTGFSSVEESRFLGKSGGDILPAERASEKLGKYGSWSMSAGGLAGVWADHNDRRSIYEAFKRREVFATTGPRIRLRMFGGYGFAASDVKSKDFGKIGYRKGVPMGGNLLRAAGGAPQLMIRAVKDPDGANLDRVQVIKGWRDAAGKLHEKLYDVAWSGNRRLDAQGNLPPVGNTVDLSRARYQNTIGAPELTVLWKDPDFRASESGYYYVRVLEIPTPRHHVFDAIAAGAPIENTKYPATIQERAFSSPIWYNP